jgi:hypothetical protein
LLIVACHSLATEDCTKCAIPLLEIRYLAVDKHKKGAKQSADQTALWMIDRLKKKNVFTTDPTSTKTGISSIRKT